jgi:hypothetical protein
VSETLRLHTLCVPPSVKGSRGKKEGESMSVVKEALLEQGKTLIDRWCVVNKLIPPDVLVYRDTAPEFGVCAYYRSNVIHIWVNSCASVGTAGRAWSYPGYSTDRTPYGVLAHELAHHVDHAHGAAGGTYGRAWATATAERPLTSYCPNVNEWFAEMFRLFVTNPDLLRRLRPKTYELMLTKWKVAEERLWPEVLRGAERQIAVVLKRI